MIRSLWSAATGMQAQNLNIDVISNNVANVSTSGYKKSRADFQDLLYQTLRSPGVASSADTEVPTGIQVGHGTRPSATQKIFSQGDFQNTENDLLTAHGGQGAHPELHLLPPRVKEDPAVLGLPLLGNVHLGHRLQPGYERRV